VPQLRFRYILPSTQLFIDIVVLALGVWHVETVRHRTKVLSLRESILIPVWMLQESGAAGWDFKYDIPPVDEFVFLGLGNPPAMIVASSLRPEALATHIKGSLWDPWWFLIQESISFPLWFVIGTYLDSQSQRLKRAAQLFLAMRCSFTVLILGPGFAKIGSFVEVLFWLAGGIYTIGPGIVWTHRKWLRRGRLS
jgi:hypothetical protein